MRCVECGTRRSQSKTGLCAECRTADPSGPHFICTQSDLQLAGPECVEHERCRVVRCWGPDANPSGTRPPCMACVKGLDYALAYAAQFRGDDLPKGKRKMSR